MHIESTVGSARNTGSPVDVVLQAHTGLAPSKVPPESRRQCTYSLKHTEVSPDGLFGVRCSVVNAHTRPTHPEAPFLCPAEIAFQCTYRDVDAPALPGIRSPVTSSRHVQVSLGSRLPKCHRDTFLQAHIYRCTDQPSLLLGLLQRYASLTGSPIPTLSLTRHLHLGGASLQRFHSSVTSRASIFLSAAGITYSRQVSLSPTHRFAHRCCSSRHSKRLLCTRSALAPSLN